ncbi:DUF4355 domain-containing protein [Lactiplantibacillus paraxiangfangensis]|uniref:DUF4355 domain-containing protein n=1 Tax=Lactiplantibacillus paraxiangfangensis TaxID=3076224 RepID=UPI0030C6F31C
MSEENVNPNAEPNPNGGQTPPASDPEESVTLTPAELQSKLDSEADKRAAKAVETAKAKWAADQAKAIEDAKNQGAKLAKMSAAEKAKAEDEARQSALDKREAELNQRELSTSTVALLADKKLPTSLADQLIKLGDADAIKTAVDGLDKAISEEVNKRVNESLQTIPPQNGSSALNGSDDPFAKKLSSYTKK